MRACKLAGFGFKVPQNPQIALKPQNHLKAQKSPKITKIPGRYFLDTKGNAYQNFNIPLVLKGVFKPFPALQTAGVVILGKMNKRR